jgi:ribonuclease P protein component
MQHPESTYRMRQDLPKKERLCSEKIIARLFQSGVFVSKYPLRLNAVVEAVMLQPIVVQPTVVDLTLVQATAMESPLVDSAVVNETFSVFSGGEGGVNQIKETIDSNNVAVTGTVQVLFSASKRRFPRAVDRNRVKRLLREVYRKNKQSLWTWALTNNQQLSIAIIYTGSDLVDYVQLEKLWMDLQARLIKKLNAFNESPVAAES